MHRPKWDCITKDMWKDAHRIMGLNHSSDFLIQNKLERKCFELLMNRFSDYSSRVGYIIANYYFKYFHITL